ncbi:MAG: hypothetical protein ACYDCL_15215 [Myxococcales bacterium]
MALALGGQRPAVLTVGRAARPDLQETRDPGGTPDPTLWVLAADDAERGTRLATLAVYGAHPTLLPRGERLLSADWPGAAARSLERHGGVALVLQGAGGDASVPRAGLPADPGERLGAYGERFATAVATALAAGAPLPPAPLRYAAAEVALPAPDLSRLLGPFHGAADRLLALWAPRTARVAVAGLGGLKLACLPGELTGAARAAWPKAETVISLCGGDISYIEAEAQWRSRRGEKLALFGPDLPERLLEGERAAER